MIKIIDFLKVVCDPFDIYHKGQYIAEIKMHEHEWLKFHYDWILDCSITSIEIYEGVLSIDTR